jgi:hypothetical protein
MNEVQQFLAQNPGDGDEPSQTLRDGLFSDLDRFVRRWNQPITRLNNYQDLLRKIGDLANENNVNTWFYIGYTGNPLGSNYYVWNKNPQNARVTAANIQPDHKSHTYYTHFSNTDEEIQEGEEIEEDEVIQENQEDEVIPDSERALILVGRTLSIRCLNVHIGLLINSGILYVLEYTVPQNNQ